MSDSRTSHKEALWHKGGLRRTDLCEACHSIIVWYEHHWHYGRFPGTRFRLCHVCTAKLFQYKHDGRFN